MRRIQNGSVYYCSFRGHTPNLARASPQSSRKTGPWFLLAATWDLGGYCRDSYGAGREYIGLRVIRRMRVVSITFAGLWLSDRTQLPLPQIAHWSAKADNRKGIVWPLLPSTDGSAERSLYRAGTRQSILTQIYAYPASASVSANFSCITAHIYLKLLIILHFIRSNNGLVAPFTSNFSSFSPLTSRASLHTYILNSWPMAIFIIIL